MKTCNTVSIEVDGLHVLATSQTFSIDGGREWRSALSQLSSGMREAISAAMVKAARLDANDPEVLDYRRRPTAKDVPACSDVTNKQDEADDDPEALIPTMVPGAVDT